MSYNDPTKEEITERRARLAPFDSVNEKVSLALFACILTIEGRWPDKYLDLGSGTGAMVNMARKVGIESYGVDLINGPENWFIKHDLNNNLQIMWDEEGKEVLTASDNKVNLDSIMWDKTSYIPMKFDLITCIEVAEHLNQSSALTLTDTIARHLDRGGRLVFSSAPPGQSGEHHTNTKPAWLWRSMFYKLGISYRPDLTMQLSHIWSWVAGPLMWLGANVQVYDK